MTYEEFEEYYNYIEEMKKKVNSDFNSLKALEIAEKEAPALIKKYVTKDTPEIWYDFKVEEFVTSKRFVNWYMIERPWEKRTLADFRRCLEVYIGIWATGGKAFKCK